MRARDVMKTEVATVFEGATVAEAARLMHASGQGGLAVLDAVAHVAGIIDQLTLVRLILPKYADDIGDLAFLPDDFKPFEARLEEIGHTPVREVMRPCDVSAAEDTSVVEIAVLMVTKNVSHVPVLRDGRLVGMVALQDIVDEIVWPHFKRDEGG